ncbi:MAG: caspase family protein [Anaerolineae bacterium]
MSRRLALIIGNSEYDDANLARLVTPGEDASDLAEVLRDPGIGGFDEVTTLINQSSLTVRRTIERFFGGKKREDLLLLYFSGHGVLGSLGRLHLAVKDTERDLLRATAIPAAYITEAMDRSRSRRQVLILDCCHSGAFARGAKGALGARVGTASAFEGVGFGRVVLTATDTTQYAWEGDRVIGEAENSVFTHFLIQGLRSGEADADRDGWVSLDELYDYTYEQVVSRTPRQTPGKWSYKQQGEIVIARNPWPVARPAVLPPELQQAIDSPFAGVRAGAVHELERLLHGSHAGLAMAAHETLKQLAEDDSRQVSMVATKSLAAHRAESPSLRPDNSGGEAAPAARAVRLWLVGPAGQSYKLKPGSLTLGRSKQCDVRLHDLQASRWHARLEFDGQHCTVYDMGSANGTYVNGQQVGAAGLPFRRGDRLTIGASHFSLSVTAPSRPRKDTNRFVVNRGE